MGDNSYGVMIRNLAVLLCVALPAAALAIAVNYGWATQEPVSSGLSNLALVYTTGWLPVAFGGSVHQLVLWKTRFSRRARAVAAATSPIVLLAYLAGFASTGFLRENLAALAVGLIVYAAMVRPFPPTDTSDSS